MPNMSYCKWENTASDMEQCAAAEIDFDYPEKLSEHERAGMRRCLLAAYDMLENAPRELLHELGIYTENLA